MNMNGSYSCLCLPGYSGDGMTCAGIYYFFLLSQITNVILCSVKSFVIPAVAQMLNVY